MYGEALSWRTVVLWEVDIRNEEMGVKYVKDG